MGIHDVDKSTTGRSKSSPNTHDGLANRQAHQTVSTTYRAPDSSEKARVQMVNGHVLVYDTNNNLVTDVGVTPTGKVEIIQYDSSNNAITLLGQAPDDSRPGLWIVRSGKDVIDELNA